MKLIIELDSKTLQKAVENQVGKAISKLTEQVIIDKVNSIIDKKVSRTADTLIEFAIERQISDKIEMAMNINAIRLEMKNKISNVLKDGFSED